MRNFEDDKKILYKAMDEIEKEYPELFKVHKLNTSVMIDHGTHIYNGDFLATLKFDPLLPKEIEIKVRWVWSKLSQEEKSN